MDMKLEIVVAPVSDVDRAQRFYEMLEPRMYQLIRQPKPIGDRDFTINFLGPVAEVCCFTFG
jgi:hypothetical protein